MDGNARDGRLRALGGNRFLLAGQSPNAETGDLGILFDGRIFNTAELAHQLGAETQNAAEILLYAYRKWGLEFPRLIEGDFSFALWDCGQARVLLGHGPGRNLPLFYAQRGESFFFARDLRHLLANMCFSPRTNESYIARWLALTHTGSEDTFFEGVFRMIPGSTLLFEQGRITQDVYWHPEKTPPLHLRDSREYADGLREVLNQAIRNRLVEHSAVGSMLSGGLDSSTVTALAAEMLAHEDRRLYAFTAVPEHSVNDVSGHFCDEGPAAASVAAMWPNVDHVLVCHGAHSVFAMMDLFGAEMLEPIFNPANYDWLYEICLQARQRQLNSLLVGDSGNLTISYNGQLALRSLAFEGRWKTLTELACDMHRLESRRCLGMAYELLSPFIPQTTRRFLMKRAHGDANSLYQYSLIRREFARDHGLDTTWFGEDTKYRDSRLLRMHVFRRPEVGSSLDAIQRLTGITRLDPTADRRVVEFCLSVPVERFCEKGVPRFLIRNAMVGRLPEKLRTERRRGLQAADVAIHFAREKEEALVEFARMKKVDLVARVLDLDKMERMLPWSSDPIATRGAVYWPMLLRAFSLGRFLRRLEDRTLFPPSVFQK